MTFSVLIILLIFYSAAGWILEVSYCAVVQHRLTNRGFLFGPLCPIYGVGCVLMAALLKPFESNYVLLFLLAAVTTTALEYATSWVLEKMFSTTWWDYSESKFNFQGRVCLENSLAFGLMGLVVVRVIHPYVVHSLDQIPAHWLRVMAAVFFVVTSVDLSFTLETLIRLDRKIAGLKQFADGLMMNLQVHAWFDSHDLKASLARLRKIALAGSCECFAIDLRRFENIVADSYGMQRMFRSFPGLQNKKHNFRLDSFKKIVSLTC